MNILDGNLKSIEEAGLEALDFGGKVTREVFVDNSIGGSEECEDVGDEMTFIIGEAFPILEIGGKVNLLGGPEASLGLFVHAPYLGLGGVCVSIVVTGNAVHMKIYMMMCIHVLTSLSRIGNKTKRPGFSFNKGSSACRPANSSSLCLDT